MKTLVLLSQKGGSGKTTLAFHLAVMAFFDELSVALIDTDPQGSASAWGKMRHADWPVVANTVSKPFEEVMKQARSLKIDLCIVDTPPHTTFASSGIAKIADFVLIPCRPTGLDLTSIHSSTLKIAKASKRPFAVTLNGCSPRGSHDEEEALASFEKRGVEVAPIRICERKAYARAYVQGKAVCEFEKNGKAAKEIEALWRWIREKMNV